MTSEDTARHLIANGEKAAWSSAALALAIRNNGTDPQRLAALDVLGALGLDDLDALGELDQTMAAAHAAAPLLQTSALLTGAGLTWGDQPDEALLAQGLASAQGAQALRQFGLSMLPGLASALESPDARMLDVGTGVAALAVAYAQVFPHLTVVGIDVSPRVLEIAARTVAASSVHDRIELREQDVSTLDEDAIYAMVWLPAPFLAAADLSARPHR